ncbi:LOW QUALITY PROTEIN: uncharacterized protein LOC144749298 [Ciona intestinalis]
MTSRTVIGCLAELFGLFGFPEYVHSDRGTLFISKETHNYLHSRGIATSNSTPYHPTGNSQCERTNQTIWKTIKLLLHSRCLPERQWEDVLCEALHAIRSVLCTATNETPHERFFRFSRRALTGTSMPTWLLNGNEVMLRRFVRNKGEPLCDSVTLLDANPLYARVRHSDGRESTVSTSDLAPCPGRPESSSESNLLVHDTSGNVEKNSPLNMDQSGLSTDHESPTGNSESPNLSDNRVRSEPALPTPVLRRSRRERRSPDRFGDWTQ